MATAHKRGASAPGPVTPRRDNAREQAGVERDQAQAHGVSLCDSRARSRGRQARRTIKRLIVLATIWGFPTAWAQWLLDRGGLTNV